MTVLFKSLPEIYYRSVPMRHQATVKTPMMSQELLNERQKKMEHLEAIENSVSPLFQRIKEATGFIEGKEYLYLQDQLERYHIALDNVDANGDDEVRKRRKSIAVFVSNTLNMLDVKANKVWEESKKNESIECEELESYDDWQTNELEEDESISDDCKDFETNNDHKANETEQKEVVEVNNHHETKENKLDNNTNYNQKDICNSKAISIVNDNKTTQCQNEVIRHSGKVKSVANDDKASPCINEEIIDNSRVRMQVFDNCANLVVDVRDIVNDDLKVRFEEGELLVIGRIGDKRVLMSKTLPGNCLFDRAVSHLSSDGFMIVNVPRRRNLHPFQIRSHPFWF